MWARTLDQASGHAGHDTAAMNPHLARRLERALDLIEQRLHAPLSLAEIAAAAHLSEFHFARTFRALSGCSVMDYLRRRRLQHAVEFLEAHPGTSVLELALEAGFGSNEAFTRAFRREYGIAPSTYRRNLGTLRLHRHRRLDMQEIHWETPAAPTFVTLPAFMVIGIADEVEPGQTERIGQMWARFVPLMGGIPGRLNPAVTYGICCPLEDARESDRFSYVAGVQVGSLEEIPRGMTGVQVPAARYAVFGHVHGIGPALVRTMRYIFGEWLPASGYELSGPDFEYYDERFDPATSTGEFFIYVPIREAGG